MVNTNVPGEFSLECTLGVLMNTPQCKSVFRDLQHLAEQATDVSLLAEDELARQVLEKVHVSFMTTMKKPTGLPDDVTPEMLEVAFASLEPEMIPVLVNLLPDLAEFEKLPMSEQFELLMDGRLLLGRIGRGRKWGSLFTEYEDTLAKLAYMLLYAGDGHIDRFLSQAKKRLAQRG
jgi:hypothetical protein